MYTPILGLETIRSAISVARIALEDLQKLPLRRVANRTEPSLRWYNEVGMYG